MDCITFTSISDDLPPPNPDYLGLHAACCRVAHMSGATDHIDRLLDAIERAFGLSENDGSSAHLLSFALEEEMTTELFATDSIMPYYVLRG